MKEKSKFELYLNGHTHVLARKVGDLPRIPPSPQAAKYFPLYSSMLGLGSDFSSEDIVKSLLYW